LVDFFAEKRAGKPNIFYKQRIRFHLFVRPVQPCNTTCFRFFMLWMLSRFTGNSPVAIVYGVHSSSSFYSGEIKMAPTIVRVVIIKTP